MAFADVLNNLTTSVTGNVPKAILCVPEVGRAYSDMIKFGSGSETLVQGAAMDLRESLLKNANSALNLGTSYSNVTASTALQSNGFVAMQVRYNPSSISMATQGSGITLRNSAGEMGDVGINQTMQNYAAALTMFRCQLIFDAVNISDAFMQEGVALNASNLASSAASLVSSYKNGGTSKYSVQTPMDGLMACLTQVVTRSVLFIWGKMAFVGELVSVDNTYTMFNPRGNPVRGVSNITIQGTAETNDWSDQFNKVFQTDIASSVAGSISNGNLLNLNI